VRELRNVIERAVIVGRGRLIDRDDIVLGHAPELATDAAGAEESLTLAEMERRHIAAALEKESGRVGGRRAPPRDLRQLASTNASRGKPDPSGSWRPLQESRRLRAILRPASFRQLLPRQPLRQGAALRGGVVPKLLSLPSVRPVEARDMGGRTLRGAVR
jgi:hypothetical protein